MASFWKYIKTLMQKITAPARGGFLCDSCKYDYGSACTRPERPNARVCPDYKKL